MAHTLDEQRASYPLAAYNFRVTVDGAAMRFSKVSGLSREHHVLTYRHGLSFVEGEQITKFRIDQYTPVTMEQGTVIGQTALHTWLERKTPCPMEVSLCNEKGIPAITWSIAKALPVKLTAPAFDARSNELSIEVFEIRAAGISIKHVE
jgi:phage tail-like protein